MPRSSWSKTWLLWYFHIGVSLYCGRGKTEVANSWLFPWRAIWWRHIQSLFINELRPYGCTVFWNVEPFFVWVIACSRGMTQPYISKQIVDNIMSRLVDGTVVVWTSCDKWRLEYKIFTFSIECLRWIKNCNNFMLSMTYHFHVINSK